MPRLTGSRVQAANLAAAATLYGRFIGLELSDEPQALLLDVKEALVDEFVDAEGA